MRYLKHRIAAAAAAAGIAFGPLCAEEFSLTYAFTFGSVLEADVTGDLQQDGDTVIVSAVENARLDGVAGPALPFVSSVQGMIEGDEPNIPVLTLSGLDNDMGACSDSTCAEEFITFDGVTQFLGKPDIYTTASFGNTMSGGANAAEQYDPANYSLVRK